MRAASRTSDSSTFDFSMRLTSGWPLLTITTGAPSLVVRNNFHFSFISSHQGANHDEARHERVIFADECIRGGFADDEEENEIKCSDFRQASLTQDPKDHVDEQIDCKASYDRIHNIRDK